MSYLELYIFHGSVLASVSMTTRLVSVRTKTYPMRTRLVFTLVGSVTVFTDSSVSDSMYILKMNYIIYTKYKF